MTDLPADLVPSVAVASEQAWMAARQDLTLWGPALAEVCGRHDLAGLPLCPAPTGSAVVVRVGDERYVKIYWPEDAGHAARERRALDLIGGRLDVPTPRILGSGSIGTCPYLVMDSLRGEHLNEVWPDLDRSARRDLAGGVGRLARALHDLPVPDPGPLALDWPSFVAEQRGTAAARQRSRGLPGELADLVEGFLAGRRATLTVTGPLALLHTELMHDHLMVCRDGGGWRLSGLFDFADALVGPPAYEIPSVGLFIACGEPALFEAFFEGYGRSPADLGLASPEDVLAWALIHRYAHVPWWLRRMPAAEGGGWVGMARRWFAAAAFGEDHGAS